MLASFGSRQVWLLSLLQYRGCMWNVIQTWTDDKRTVLAANYLLSVCQDQCLLFVRMAPRLVLYLTGVQGGRSLMKYWPDRLSVLRLRRGNRHRATLSSLGKSIAPQLAFSWHSLSIPRIACSSCKQFFQVCGN